MGRYHYAKHTPAGQAKSTFTSMESQYKHIECNYLKRKN